MSKLLTVLLVIVVIVILAVIFYNLFNKHLKKIHRLPLHLMGYSNIPAVPIQIGESIKTLVQLSGRSTGIKPAVYGLSNRYKISGESGTGFQFLYGKENIEAEDDRREDLQKRLKLAASKMVLLPKDQVLKGVLEDRLPKPPPPPKFTLTSSSGVTYQDLFLDKPEQFSLSWTCYYNVYEKAQDLLPLWSKTLTDVAVANEQFWPTIAKYGLAYNLLIAQKVTTDQLSVLQAEYGSEWTEEMNELSQQGLLYAIDMTIYKNVPANEVDDFVRFTPSTFTLLKQDPTTKALTPFTVWVSGQKGSDQKCYTANGSKAGAWLYALQAAKVSITVYGIWSGHVYHWHIVTAAMQMYFYNTIPDGHAIYQLLQPISNYLIPFDDVLLLLWGDVAPPTSISTSSDYLTFTNIYAEGRSYFDDDPHKSLQNLGISEADFTVKTPWDAYPIVGQALEVWELTQQYIIQFVEHSYASDQAVQQDQPLQDWIKACGQPLKGNIHGLPAMNSRQNLIEVLTSFVYRITVHGASRMIPVANPALSFIPNFPPCLQRTDRPDPNQDLSTKDLLSYLPNTGTIGSMMTFYNTFSFSAPYEPLLPLEGLTRDLFFDDGNKNDSRNKALIAFRKGMRDFMDENIGDGLIHQWPRNIET